MGAHALLCSVMKMARASSVTLYHCPSVRTSQQWRPMSKSNNLYQNCM